MKFEYDEVNDRGECVAELFHMQDEPENICLNIYSGCKDVITLYYDGHRVAQNRFDTSGCSIKKFYKGDKITITF